MPNAFELNLKIEHNLDRLKICINLLFKGGNNQSIVTQLIIEIITSFEVLKFVDLNNLMINFS